MKNKYVCLICLGIALTFSAIAVLGSSARIVPPPLAGDLVAAPSIPTQTSLQSFKAPVFRQPNSLKEKCMYMGQKYPDVRSSEQDFVTLCIKRSSKCLSRHGDYLRRRNVNQNIGVVGSIGFGKTSLIDTLQFSLWSLGDGGLILCAKPDAAKRAIEIARKCGKGGIVSSTSIEEAGGISSR